MKYGMLKSSGKKSRDVTRAAALALTLLLGAFGCAKEGKPRGLLTKEQMVTLMADMYLAEQKLSTVGVPRDSVILIMNEMSTLIFEKSGTADSVFRMSFDYYLQHPVEMEEIYTVLIDSLNLREQRMISNEVKK